MALTRDEWHNRLPPRAARSPANLDVIAREAVRMKALTGDENWDYFLSYIEAALRASETQLNIETAKLRSPYLVNDEAIRALKAQITFIEARIHTLKEVLMLPKYLKEHGEAAKAQIADMAKGA